MSTPNNERNARDTIFYDRSGIVDPTVEAVEAPAGTTYRLLLGNNQAKFFQKMDEGLTTNWKDVSADYTFATSGTGLSIIKTVDNSTRTVTFYSLKQGPGIILIQNANDIEIQTDFGSYQLDGGHPDSNYGGTVAVDGGVP